MQLRRMENDVSVQFMSVGEVEKTSSSSNVSLAADCCVTVNGNHSLPISLGLRCASRVGLSFGLSLVWQRKGKAGVNHKKTIHIGGLSYPSPVTAAFVPVAAAKQNTPAQISATSESQNKNWGCSSFPHVCETTEEKKALFYFWGISREGVQAGGGWRLEATFGKPCPPPCCPEHGLGTWCTAPAHTLRRRISGFYSDLHKVGS